MPSLKDIKEDLQAIGSNWRTKKCRMLQSWSRMKSDTDFDNAMIDEVSNVFKCYKALHCVASHYESLCFAFF